MEFDPKADYQFVQVLRDSASESYSEAANIASRLCSEQHQTDPGWMRLFGEWAEAGKTFKIDSKLSCGWLKSYGPNPKTGVFYFFPSCWIEPAGLVTQKCRCDVFFGPCTCGEFRTEMEQRGLVYDKWSGLWSHE